MSDRREQSSLWLAAVLILLGASLPSFVTIPFLQPWPLDFQNLWTFHDCALGRANPYLVSGRACGDAGARDMLYPPLLYWLFGWTRWLRYGAASHVWTVVVALGTLFSTMAWAPRDTWRGAMGGRTGLFLGLLLAQFPLVFALERGNNDVIVLATWTGAIWLYRQERVAAAGALAGLGAILKLYPAFACVVVGVGLVVQAIRQAEHRRRLLTFASAGVAVIVLGFLATYEQSLFYLKVTLPRTAALAPPLTYFGHPLRTLWDLWGGWALSVPLLVAWCVASALTLRRDPSLVFAGALAISTYFAQTSWDYNLITTFPLLLVLFLRASASGSRASFALLLLGLAAIVGHRSIFASGVNPARAHLFLQWLFLLVTGLVSPWIAQAAEEADRITTATSEAPPAALSQAAGPSAQ